MNNTDGMSLIFFLVGGMIALTLLLIVLSCVTLITLDTRNGRTGSLGAMGRIAHRIVSPVQGAVDDVARPVGDWWDGIVNSGDLKRDNRRLQEQIAATLYDPSESDDEVRSLFDAIRS